MNRTFDEAVATITKDPQAMGIIENILHKTQKDAFEEGIEKGIEKGIEQGMEKGIETGSARTLRANIGKLLLKGFTVEQVAEILEVELALAEAVADALRKEGKLK